MFVVDKATISLAEKLADKSGTDFFTLMQNEFAGGKFGHGVGKFIFVQFYTAFLNQAARFPLAFAKARGD